MGHIRDLPKSQIGVEVENDFNPKYITIRGKGSILKELKDASKKVKKVYLAADPDREGEAIAWHLAHYLEMDETEACRVVFNEITKASGQGCIQDTAQNQYGSWSMPSRRDGFWIALLDIKLVRCYGRKSRKGLSAGRVQSVAVKLIIDRENEIDAFDSGRILDDYRASCKQKSQPFEASFIR